MCTYADDLALCKQLAGIKEDYYSGHDNPIFLSPEIEAQAQYNENNVVGRPPLQQGVTA